MGVAVVKSDVTGAARPQAGEPVPRRPRTSWRPLRVYSYDHELRSTRVHTYGYRGECSCGWHGPTRQTIHAVRADIRQHRQGHET